MTVPRGAAPSLDDGSIGRKAQCPANVEQRSGSGSSRGGCGGLGTLGKCRRDCGAPRAAGRAKPRRCRSLEAAASRCGPVRWKVEKSDAEGAVRNGRRAHGTKGRRVDVGGHGLSRRAEAEAASLGPAAQRVRRPHMHDEKRLRARADSQGMSVKSGGGCWWLLHVHRRRSHRPEAEAPLAALARQVHRRWRQHPQAVHGSRPGATATAGAAAATAAATAAAIAIAAQQHKKHQKQQQRRPRMSEHQICHKISGPSATPESVSGLVSFVRDKLPHKQRLEQQQHSAWRQHNRCTWSDARAASQRRLCISDWPPW
eukprot:350841-Chlamydomonas_euryale.AAC.6